MSEQQGPQKTVAVDVLVVGSGPAGLAAAAALATTGLRVVGLSPAPHATWPNSYGVWLDEIAGYEPFLAHRWADTVAQFGEGEIALRRSYGLLDNAALQQHLHKRCEQHSAVWHQGVAVALEHNEIGSRLTTQAGRVYQARLVIDASGHVPKFVSRPAGNPAFQTAFGVVGRFSAPPIPAGQMLLMDYRNAFLSLEERRTPTFLYAMNLGGGLCFAEETSLAHRPGLSMETLKNRLERRLAARGVTITETVALEHCRFPMGLPLPDLQQRVVGFGGAASMVHPASGYMVAAALRRAPELAAAVAHSLGGAQGAPSAASTAAWQALWPQQRVRQRQLYLFGLEALLTLDSAQLQAFFDAFFKLPPHLWQGYLAGTLSRADILRTMTGMFRYAPSTVRLPLFRAALGQHRSTLLRAFG